MNIWDFNGIHGIIMKQSVGIVKHDDHDVSFQDVLYITSCIYRFVPSHCDD